MRDKRKILRFTHDKRLETGEEKVKPEIKKRDSKFYRSLSVATNLGLSISLPIAGGAFLGRFLDNKFQTSPKMTLSLIFLGLILGLTNMYFIIKDINN